MPEKNDPTTTSGVSEELYRDARVRMEDRGERLAECEATAVRRYEEVRELERRLEQARAATAAKRGHFQRYYDKLGNRGTPNARKEVAGSAVRALDDILETLTNHSEPVEAGVGEEAGPEPDGPKTFFDWATMEAILDALPGPLTATDRQPIPGGGLYPTRKRDLTRDEARGALTAALWKAIPAGVRS